VLGAALAGASAQEPPALPGGRLAFGAFTASFDSGGTFSIEGRGWPPLKGSWKAEGTEVVLVLSDGPEGCDAPGRYRFRLESGRPAFELVSDACTPRRMILDRSSWRPAGVEDPVPPRRIVRVGDLRPPRLPRAEPASGSWPSFRGPAASGLGEGRGYPEQWDAPAGRNVLWRRSIPGLGHSSPVVWGHRVFVTSAISSRSGASFRPGLYGDGDASDDRSRHRFMLYALDKRSGRVLWERVAHEGEPIDRRHVKSTYASSSPATDGRVVVAWFGSQGLYAYDVEGRFLWKLDLGRLDLGAYDIPTYEWGPASSPVIWNGLVFLQCDTQADSFLLAVKAETGETVWKAERDELPSWGTPTLVTTSAGPELVANASDFIRGYDPRTGQERWRLGGSSKITAPTPIAADDLVVVASGRAPERPIFAVRPGARGDLTLPEGKTSSGAVAWSRTGRGSYMPTPLALDGRLYVLANNGVFDAYDLKTGAELYRQRLPQVGSGFSASPVAAEGRLYLSGEDGDVLVVAAGPEFRLLATNPMGELLMATPALSEGVLYVRTAQSLFAIGSPGRGAPQR
jgi:outer membrane protein assembly factor BamB